MKPLADKFKVPNFASEAEEAQWWYDHREEVTHAFEEAAARGELRTGSAARLARQRATGITPTTTIRLDPQDISRARSLAAKRGVRYQTYLKMLLHEALAAEEKKLAS
jgi:predicted DNA binding CopG/RHH family protein